MKQQLEMLRCFAVNLLSNVEQARHPKGRQAICKGPPHHALHDPRSYPPDSTVYNQLHCYKSLPPV